MKLIYTIIMLAYVTCFKNKSILVTAMFANLLLPTIEENHIER